MPAQQHRRRDQKDSAPPPRQEPGQGGEDGPVGGGVARPGHLAAQHHQLVAQHRDLHILRVRGRTDPDQTENPPDDQEP
jgi:hypothetical protein